MVHIYFKYKHIINPTHLVYVDKNRLKSSMVNAFLMLFFAIKLTWNKTQCYSVWLLKCC